jgi:hypothetical protein
MGVGATSGAEGLDGQTYHQLAASDRRGREKELTDRGWARDRPADVLMFQPLRASPLTDRRPERPTSRRADLPVERAASQMVESFRWHAACPDGVGLARRRNPRPSRRGPHSALRISSVPRYPPPQAIRHPTARTSPSPPLPPSTTPAPRLAAATHVPQAANSARNASAAGQRVSSHRPGSDADSAS